MLSISPFLKKAGVQTGIYRSLVPTEIYGQGNIILRHGKFTKWFSILKILITIIQEFRIIISTGNIPVSHLWKSLVEWEHSQPPALRWPVLMEDHNILTIMAKSLIRNTKYRGKNYFHNLIKPKALEYLCCQYILKHIIFLDSVYIKTYYTSRLCILH